MEQGEQTRGLLLVGSIHALEWTQHQVGNSVPLPDEGQRDHLDKEAWDVADHGTEDDRSQHCLIVPLRCVEQKAAQACHEKEAAADDDRRGTPRCVDTAVEENEDVVDDEDETVHRQEHLKVVIPFQSHLVSCVLSQKLY